MAFVEIKEVSKTYGEQHALDQLSLSMELGKQYAIVGASGSGKSTLLYMMGGLERPDQGKVIIDGKNLSSLEDGELAKYRNQNVGFIFQFHFLLPSITNLKNILLPCEIGGGDSSRVKKMALELADHLNVAHCLKKYPYQLSGGEQQRINIIRALSMRPKLLLCDEPTGNLDSENSSKVTELLKSLATEFGSTLVVVTHDRGIAHSFTDKFIMKDGRLNL
ncbi:MAG: hypothetical protein CME60_10115 [Halobacteriovoraceae bacterium]|nr:hypothetical protein [Halobacteriovoraceae bacterium]|tara:strand:- start:3648 stop:4307 length:660 start_codon:yes stop_codon:yes gene_type:complete